MFSWLYSQNPIDKRNEIINNIKINPIASALLSSDEKRNILEKKILDLKTEGLRITLEQTNTLIQESISRITQDDVKDESELHRRLTLRKIEIEKKINANSIRLAELSLSLSSDTLALMNSDKFNPIFILAQKIANAPENEQKDLIISWSNQINSLNEVLDNEGNPILPYDRIIPKQMIRNAIEKDDINNYKKLARMIGGNLSNLNNWDIKKLIVSGGFLVKFGMFPYITTGICINTPFSFFSGIPSGLMYSTLCLGFLGLMIYRSENLKNIIKTFVQGKWDWNSDDNIYKMSTMHSIIKSASEVLVDGHYALLTDDLPIAFSASLKIASAFELLSDFKTDPINTASKLSEIMHQTRNISKSYIIAFSNIQRNMTSLFFDIISDTVEEQIKSAGHTIEKGAETVFKTVATSAITIGETGYNVGAIAAEQIGRVGEKALNGIKSVVFNLKKLGTDKKFQNTLENSLENALENSNILESIEDRYIDDNIESIESDIQYKSDNIKEVFYEDDFKQKSFENIPQNIQNIQNFIPPLNSIQGSYQTPYLPEIIDDSFKFKNKKAKTKNKKSKRSSKKSSRRRK